MCVGNILPAPPTIAILTMLAREDGRKARMRLRGYCDMNREDDSYEYREMSSVVERCSAYILATTEVRVTRPNAQQVTGIPIENPAHVASDPFDRTEDYLAVRFIDQVILGMILVRSSH
jgi:hypothetical protein